jgi:hypothetical protein
MPRASRSEAAQGWFNSTTLTAFGKVAGKWALWSLFGALEVLCRFGVVCVPFDPWKVEVA